MDNWCTIESDPLIFTELIHKYGSTDAQVSDVFVLDDMQALKQMGDIYGFIFLFRWDKDVQQQNLNIQYPQNLFFAKQVINNACATQAILSILLNQNEQFKIGDDLKNLKQFSKVLDPESIGYSIGQCNNIRVMHNSFSRPEPFHFSSNQKIQNKKKEDLYHFVSYINFQNSLYEIDGLQQGPILHRQNLQNYDDWLKATTEVIGQRIKLYSNKEVRFHLLAVHKSYQSQICEQIQNLEQQLFNIQSYLKEQDQSLIKHYPYKNQLQVTQEINNNIEQLKQDQQSLIQRLIEYKKDFKLIRNKNKEIQKELERKRHNYIPMIFEMFKICAKEGNLLKMYEDTKKQLNFINYLFYYLD